MPLLRTIAIVGGGFSGVSVVINLLRRPPTGPTRIVLHRTFRFDRPRRRLRQTLLSLSAERAGEPHVGEPRRARGVSRVRASSHSARER